MTDKPIVCSVCANDPEWSKSILSGCGFCNFTGWTLPDCEHGKPKHKCGRCGPCSKCGGFSDKRERMWCEFCFAIVCNRCSVSMHQGVDNRTFCYCSDECAEAHRVVCDMEDPERRPNPVPDTW